MSMNLGHELPLEPTACDWCGKLYPTGELRPAATAINIDKSQISFDPKWLCTACMARYDQEETERIANVKPGTGQYPLATRL